MRIRMAIAAASALTLGTVAEAQQRVRPTEAELFCRDLQRVVRSAPDFEFLYKAKPAPPQLGFRPGACRAFEQTASLPPAFWCHQHLTPNHLAFDKLVAMTTGCLPEAKRVGERDGRQATFEAPRVRILISERGGPGAKVGRITSYRVEARP